MNNVQYVYDKPEKNTWIVIASTNDIEKFHMAKYKLYFYVKVWEILTFCSELIIELAASEIVNSLKKKEKNYDRQKYAQRFWLNFRYRDICNC